MVQPTNNAPQTNPLALVPAQGAGNGAVALSNVDTKVVSAAEALDHGHYVMVATQASANGLAFRQLAQVHEASLALATETSKQANLQIAAVSNQLLQGLNERPLNEQGQVINILGAGTNLLMTQAGNGFKNIHDTVYVPIAEQAVEGNKNIMMNAIAAQNGTVTSVHQEMSLAIGRAHQDQVSALQRKIEAEREKVKREKERIENEIAAANGKQEAISLAAKTQRENYKQALEALKVHMAQYDKEVEQAYKQFGSKGSMHLITTEPKIIDNGNGTYSVKTGEVSWRKHG